jgi:glycosyltransferase involved in cell wall biosynthesis
MMKNDTALPFLLTVVVPIFNEERTVRDVVNRICSLNLPGGLDLILVNDGSTDSTPKILDELAAENNLRVIHQPSNGGKGKAVRTGIQAATGTHVLVFDADTEYDPLDIPRLVQPLLTGRAEVVYGVRQRGNQTMLPTLTHAVGNIVMTASANILFSTAISDLHTCLKLLPRPLLQSMTLREQGFGLDTEITCEMLRAGFRPFEIPVGYVGRSKEEGKKIKFSDALQCFAVMIRVRTRPITRPGLRNRSLAPRVR